MAIHAIFRSDSMSGTVHGKHLVSVRMTEDLDNGLVIVPGALEAGEREVRTYAAPSADATIGKIAILGSEEVDTGATFDTVGGFYNKKGTIARAYILEHEDMFSVSAEGWKAVPAVGDTVKVAAGEMKLGTAGDVTIGECIAIEQDGNTTWYVVRV